MSEKIKAILEFLEKITLVPGEVTSQDAASLRLAGISQKAIEEALYVCCLFNIMDRLADAFDFQVPSAHSLQKDGRILYNSGYRLMSIPG